MEAWVVALVELIFCYGVLKMCAFLFALHWWTKRHARKLIHMATGPIHMAFWPLFASSSSWDAALWSAATPALLTARLVLIPYGWADDALVAAMARSGDARELWRGPLVYGAAHVAVTIFFFKTRLAVLVLLTLCVGDGVAAVLGTQLPLAPLPWNRKKSVGGSVSFFVFAGLAIYTINETITNFEIFSVAVSALIESLALWGEWDNAVVRRTI